MEMLLVGIIFTVLFIVFVVLASLAIDWIFKIDPDRKRLNAWDKNLARESKIMEESERIRKELNKKDLTDEERKQLEIEKEKNNEEFQKEYKIGTAFLDQSCRKMSGYPPMTEIERSKGTGRYL